MSNLFADTTESTNI